MRDPATNGSFDGKTLTVHRTAVRPATSYTLRPHDPTPATRANGEMVLDLWAGRSMPEWNRINGPGNLLVWFRVLPNGPQDQRETYWEVAS